MPSIRTAILLIGLCRFAFAEPGAQGTGMNGMNGNQYGMPQMSPMQMQMQQIMQMANPSQTQSKKRETSQELQKAQEALSKSMSESLKILSEGSNASQKLLSSAITPVPEVKLELPAPAAGGASSGSGLNDSLNQLLAEIQNRFLTLSTEMPALKAVNLSQGMQVTGQPMGLGNDGRGIRSYQPYADASGGVLAQEPPLRMESGGHRALREQK